MARCCRFTSSFHRTSVWAVLLMVSAFGAGFMISARVPLRSAIMWLPGQLVAAGSSAEAQEGTREWQQADVQSFQDFPVYWLGADFEGLKLTRIIRHISPPTVPVQENLVLLIYGDCTPQGDTGCSPPLSIRLERTCARPRESFAAQSFDAPHIPIRGLDAARVSGHLRMWTPQTAITIFNGGGARGDELSLRAAAALRPGNQVAAREIAGAARAGELPGRSRAC